MEEGERLADSLAAAGGATAEGQLSCVNLALRVQDEAHFHVPGPGEPCPVLSEAEGQALSTSTAGSQGDTRIDLNTASEEDLKTLPGIGEVKARAIVGYRERNGPFQSIEDIIQVNGIGPAIYEGIRDLVRVNGVSR